MTVTNTNKIDITEFFGFWGHGDMADSSSRDQAREKQRVKILHWYDAITRGGAERLTRACLKSFIKTAPYKAAEMGFTSASDSMIDLYFARFHHVMGAHGVVSKEDFLLSYGIGVDMDAKMTMEAAQNAFHGLEQQMQLKTPEHQATARQKQLRQEGHRRLDHDGKMRHAAHYNRAADYFRRQFVDHTK
jgi:hypothetical protein